DLADDFVRGRIDDVDVITCTVRLDDTHLTRHRSLSGRVERVSANPCRERLPFGIVFRLPMLAAVVMRVATGCFGERMEEQLTFFRTTCDDSLLDHVKVLARLFFGPRRIAGSQRLKAHGRAARVTRNAARVARTLGGEDRLNARFEKFEVEVRGRRRGL